MPSAKENVSDAWKRIETWIRANDRSGKLALPPGASSSDIAYTEWIVGARLPRDVRQSYEIHDGSKGIWIFEQGFLMPLKGAGGGSRIRGGGYNVVDLWTSMLTVGALMREERSEPKGPIRADWWNRGWIPLTENQCGDSVCIDLAPRSRGREGQVIGWWHERGATHVLAAGFAEWLSGCADRLEAGGYRLVESGAVVPVERSNKRRSRRG
jgi:cell wall assembly regulator SMI1